jgi:predicted DNA-binding protein
MHLHRPSIARQWTRSVPASLRPEQIQALHALSRRTGRTIRRIVTEAVLAFLDDARAVSTRAA